MYVCKGNSWVEQATQNEQKLYLYSELLLFNYLQKISKE